MRRDRQKPIITKLVEPPRMRFSGLHPLRCIKAQHDFFRYSPDSQCLAGSSVSISPYGPYLASISLLIFFLSRNALQDLLCSIFLLASTTSVNAQAVVAPTLGVKGFLQSLMFSAFHRRRTLWNVDIPQNLDICTATWQMQVDAFPFIITLILALMVHDRSRRCK
ncbi:hypothetical protein BJV77DRAFT_320644 [Russula vinacea]|nr:hypothetical protein BJV77DRAFT_320644 [Russula vinacea]